MNDLLSKIINKRPGRKAKADAEALPVNPQPRIGILLPAAEITAARQAMAAKAAERSSDPQRQALQEWMRSAKDYCKRFLTILREREIITYENLEHYIDSGDIFRDIYFLKPDGGARRPGVLKVTRTRGSTGNIDKVAKRLPNLRLVFVFSTKNWDVLYKKFRPSPARPDVTLTSTKITKVHGLPFVLDVNARTILLIPLVQMDQKVFNNLLRNSYFDYLGEGLDVAEHYV